MGKGRTENYGSKRESMIRENKNLAIQRASGEWILFPAADEINTQSGLQIPLDLLSRASHRFLKNYMLQSEYRGRMPKWGY
jgi:hypothetical protein